MRRNSRVTREVSVVLVVVVVVVVVFAVDAAITTMAAAFVIFVIAITIAAVLVFTICHLRENSNCSTKPMSMLFLHLVCDSSECVSI